MVCWYNVCFEGVIYGPFNCPSAVKAARLCGEETIEFYNVLEPIMTTSINITGGLPRAA